METLLDIQGLTKHFPIPAGGFLRKKYNMLKAVDGVSFSVPKGTCFGIAGESGSGKTTVSKLVLLEEKPTAGTILFDGKDITTFTRQETHAVSQTRPARIPGCFKLPGSQYADHRYCQRTHGHTAKNDTPQGDSIQSAGVTCVLSALDRRACGNIPTN